MLSGEEQKRRDAYLRRKQRRKWKRNIQIVKRIAIVGVAAVLVMIGAAQLSRLQQKQQTQTGVDTPKAVEAKSDFQQNIIEQAPDYQVKLLTPNPYSRSQTKLEKVKGIVIHYTANPGTTAEQNRNYFESLKETKKTKASSHFVVGIEGEIVQCIPSTEISYASNDRNSDTLSIECCHMDKSGKFSQETYDSLVELTAWLCGKFNLPVESVIRHYDVTKKECPLYYVENEDAWKKFKKDVQEYLDTKGTAPEKNLS